MKTTKEEKMNLLINEATKRMDSLIAKEIQRASDSELQLMGKQISMGTGRALHLRLEKLFSKELQNAIDKSVEEAVRYCISVSEMTDEQMEHLENKYNFTLTKPPLTQPQLDREVLERLKQGFDTEVLRWDQDSPLVKFIANELHLQSERIRREVEGMKKGLNTSYIARKDCMREIKFRAWDGKKMTNQFSLWSDGKIASRIAGFTNNKPLELMQFTGLKDKNGVEIYEGDIVRGSAFEDGNLQVGEIAWFRQGYDIAGINTDGEFNEFMEWIDVGNIEVIGNIYENPELIEEQNQ